MNRRSALRALGITGAGLAGAGLVGPVPPVLAAMPADPGEPIICHVGSHYWPDWTAPPGLELPQDGDMMLTLSLSTGPGGASTVSVGCEGPVYGQRVPLTPAILAGILHGVAVDQLFFIHPEEADHWLDPFVEPEPDPNWKPWVPPSRGVYTADPRENGSIWYAIWTSEGKCHRWFMPAGGDAKSFVAELWRQLDRMDPTAYKPPNRSRVEHRPGPPFERGEAAHQGVRLKSA
jgi:hypothetical protein